MPPTFHQTHAQYPSFHPQPQPQPLPLHFRLLPTLRTSRFRNAQLNPVPVPVPGPGSSAPVGNGIGGGGGGVPSSSLCPCITVVAYVGKGGMGPDPYLERRKGRKVMFDDELRGNEEEEGDGETMGEGVNGGKYGYNLEKGEIEVVRILDPEHREPFISLSSLFAIHSPPLTPLQGLLRFRKELELPFAGWDRDLGGLAPFEDIWTPLPLARRISKFLGLYSHLSALLDWESRSAWSLEEVPPDIWETEGRGLVHNWRIGPEEIDPEKYSTDAMLSTPFQRIQVLPPGTQLRTQLDPDDDHRHQHRNRHVLSRQPQPQPRVLASFLGLGLGGGGGGGGDRQSQIESVFGGGGGTGSRRAEGQDWRKAWENILRWSLLVFEEWEVFVEDLEAIGEEGASSVGGGRGTGGYGNGNLEGRSGGLGGGGGGGGGYDFSSISSGQRLEREEINLFDSLFFTSLVEMVTLQSLGRVCRDSDEDGYGPDGVDSTGGGGGDGSGVARDRRSYVLSCGSKPSRRERIRITKSDFSSSFASGSTSSSVPGVAPGLTRSSSGSSRRLLEQEREIKKKLMLVDCMGRFLIESWTRVAEDRERKAESFGGDGRECRRSHVNGNYKDRIREDTRGVGVSGYDPKTSGVHARNRPTMESPQAVEVYPSARIPTGETSNGLADRQSRLEAKEDKYRIRLSKVGWLEKDLGGLKDELDELRREVEVLRRRDGEKESGSGRDGTTGREAGEVEDDPRSAVGAQEEIGGGEMGLGIHQGEPSEGSSTPSEPGVKPPSPSILSEPFTPSMAGIEWQDDVHSDLRPSDIRTSGDRKTSPSPGLGPWTLRWVVFLVGMALVLSYLVSPALLYHVLERALEIDGRSVVSRLEGLLEQATKMEHRIEEF